jgi:hypothetical protein
MSSFVINSYAFGSVFSPAALSPAIWLDASDSATITSSGSPALVSQWDDKSGNSNNFDQSTSGNRPTTGAATQNSLNVLSFSGNQSLVGPTTPNLDAVSGNPFEVYVACDASSTGTWFSQSDQTNATIRKFQLFRETQSVELRIKGGLTQINRSPQTGRFRVAAFQWSGTAGDLLDGNTAGAATISAFSETSIPLRVGARGPSVSFSLNGTIGEIVVVMSTLTSTQRTDLLTYLSNKWSITL